jgi:opacity protein-like surface antigen
MKFLAASIASALVFASTAVMAADGGGFYAGAGVGSYGVDVGAFSGDDIGYKVFGGWMFNEYIGAELEYVDGGTAEDHGLEVDVSGFNASIKGSWPVSDQFDVFAKVGYVFWDADFHDDDFGSDSDSGEDFSWGVGAGFDFTDHLGATIEYQGYEIEDTDTVDFISASVIWKF